MVRISARARWGIGVVAAMSLLAPRGGWAEDARQILLNSLEPKAPTYVGEQVSEVQPATGESRVPRRKSQVQRVYRKGKVLRIDYADGRVFFDDGDRQLLYVQRQSIVEQGPSGLTPQKLVQQRQAIRRRRVTVESLPDDTVAGRPAYVVLVKMPKGQRTVWIDKQTYLQLRQDAYQPNGRLVSTYFRSIDFHEPPADKITFTPPAGAPLVERGGGRPVPPAEAAELARAWGGLLEPKMMPAGYVFSGYFRHRFNGQPLLVGLYTAPRGKRSLSMFQGPTSGMGSMTERPKGANLRVLAARKGQADVLLVAPLPEEELQRIMGSVAPQ